MHLSQNIVVIFFNLNFISIDYSCVDAGEYILLLTFSVKVKIIHKCSRVLILFFM